MTQHTTTTRIARSQWWALIVLFLSVLGVAVNSVVYANNVSRRSNQQWCAIIVTLDDAYRRTPPTSAAGQDLAREMARLRREFHCQEGR